MGGTTIIVNPVAGGGQSAGRWERVRPLLRELGLDYTLAVTSGPGEATRLAASAVVAGQDLLVAVGGDGTANEVANGIMLATDGAPGDVTLGLIPTGRGVDLCRTLGVPHDYRAAARRLRDGQRRQLDVGEVECQAGGGTVRRYFLNFAGLGFDTEVIRHSRTARGGGSISYLSGILLGLLAFRNKAVEIALGDEVIRRRVALIVAANGRYFAGGMRIAPQADPSDGLLDVLVIGDLGKAELVANLPRVYRGTHLTHPKVQLWRGPALAVRSAEQVFVEVDGDEVGELPAWVRVHRARLGVLV